MLDDPAAIDPEQVVVGCWTSFRIGLDQGEDEIPVRDIAPGNQNWYARWPRDICDARLHSSDPVAYL